MKTLINKIRHLFSTAEPPKKATPMTACGTPPHQPKMIAIASGKGGVGKSTVTANLAAALNLKGYRVGILDADIYGPSQASLLGAHGAVSLISDDGHIEPVELNDHCYFVSISTLLEGDGPVLWRAPMATRLISDLLNRVKWPKLDYLLVDLPPGTGDIQITLAQQAKLAGGIIVTTPQKLACDIAEKAMQMFAKVHIPVIGVVENMSGYVCEHCHQDNHIFSDNGGTELANKHQTQCLAKIPLSAQLVELANSGDTIAAIADEHPVKLSYLNLAEQMLETLAAMPLSAAQVDYSLSEDKSTLTITPQTGDSISFSAYQCRVQCPCANCIDEVSGEPILDPATVPLNITIENIQPVGFYGIKLTFSDGGHNTGIYTFEYLKALADLKSQQANDNFEV